MARASGFSCASGAFPCALTIRKRRCAPNPRPPSSFKKGKALLRALPKLKRPVRLLMRQTALEQLLVHVSIALRDPATTALTTAFLRQIRLLIPASCREKVRIAIAPDFLHEQTVLAARCIIFLHLGTIIVAAAMALTA